MDPLKQLSTLQPTKRAFSLVEEFKAFAFKGNVIDLAVGVIIGAAFGKIVDSLVKNVLMPFIGAIVPGEGGYTTWAIDLNGKSIPFGLFLGDVVNFVLIALVLFLFIRKFLGWVMRTRKEEAKAVPPLTKDQELLAEIRDLLRSQKGPEPVVVTPNVTANPV
jgi:large conductance mechanosensitive channel